MKRYLFRMNQNWLLSRLKLWEVVGQYPPASQNTSLSAARRLENVSCMVEDASQMPLTSFLIVGHTRWLHGSIPPPPFFALLLLLLPPAPSTSRPTSTCPPSEAAALSTTFTWCLRTQHR